MAAPYVPPKTDPDTSMRWRRSPDPSLWHNRHRGDSSIPKYPYPSNYYYPSYSPPPPKGYNTSYAPHQAQTSIPGYAYPPPPGPPQPYWHQNWPHSSLTPYPMQSPTYPVNYYPPPPPPSSAFQNYPAPYQYQQPALTLYINPALLTPTPTPFYNRPVSPQPGHPAPYNDVDQPPRWRDVNPSKKVRFRPKQGTLNLSPSRPQPPPNPTPFPLKWPSDPVAPVPVRPSSPTSPASSPQTPPGIPLPPRLPSRLPASGFIPGSIPPSYDDFCLPEKNTGVSTRQIKSPVQPLSPNSLPQPPFWNPTRRSAATVKSEASTAENVSETLAQTQTKSTPLLPEVEKLLDSYPTPATPALVYIPQTRGSRVTDQRRANDFRVRIGQIVNRDKLEQALKNADPELKVLEDLVDLPRLLELLNLEADKIPGDEDAAVGQVSNTREHSEGAPGEVILPGNSSPNEEDEINTEDYKLRIRSIRETSVENVVPEIPPSPLGYSIDLVCVDGDHDGSDVDNYDTANSLDPSDLPDGHSTHPLPGESRSKSEDEIQN